MDNRQAVFHVETDRAFVPFASSFLPSYTGVLSVGKEAIRFDIQSQRAQGTALGKIGDFSILLSPTLQPRYQTHVVLLRHADKVVVPLFVVFVG